MGERKNNKAINTKEDKKNLYKKGYIILVLALNPVCKIEKANLEYWFNKFYIIILEGRKRERCECAVRILNYYLS